jgi:hypothetical protein
MVAPHHQLFPVPAMSGLGSLHKDEALGIPDPAIIIGPIKERKASPAFKQPFYVASITFVAGNDLPHVWAKDWKVGKFDFFLKFIIALAVYL